MKLTGAQIIIKRLLAHGVDTVFGYPGGAVLTLYDELYKNAKKIRHILTAHEQGAAHAADGYARVSGKTGVVIATSGPGATNLVTGIANAYLDSVPMVAITGNVSVPLLGKDSFQEVDIVGITQAVVKHNFLVRDVKNLEHTLNEAFRIAGSGRPGPVLIDVPKNIQSETCLYTGGDPTPRKVASAGESEPLDLSPVISAIKNSKRPYIYAGGGVISGDACGELRALSERLSAPVGLSMMGLTALPADYALNLGMTGMHGRYASTVVKSESDLLIALGARFSDRATGNVDEYGEGKTIIHVDIDGAEIGKNVPPHIKICGDVKNFLVELLRQLPEMRSEEWLSRIAELKRSEESHHRAAFNPLGIIETVRGYCGGETVIATDVGQHQMWVAQYYQFQKPRTLLTSGGLGAMGFGLGAAIGGCIAAGGKRTVLFTGDGSFGMNLTELATAVSEKLPVLIVILNNGVLGLPRQWQTVFYGGRYSHSTLDRKTDFAALAKAFGAEGHTAGSFGELEGVLKNLPAQAPVVVDCRIGMDEKVLPMIPPGGSVKDMILK
ncbi:MAG: biosynthetic-type acetolactate synthase large subunit [Clostridiales bacterium]|nr:biosynthetic-type acetolactate synthase large subunit [Clostridiales bacterium]